ncbi:hypothetical protein QOZ80_2BG0157740 [Eleusine coracana subsp. coracana]|nr:hypothetical protein QOZ80_2BG0157740 [Eleusine coracana subsp. coracana]
MGDANKSKGITMKVTVMQQLLKEEAKLQKKIKAEIRQDEELKAMEKNCDEKMMRMLNGDFEGVGSEDLKSFYDKLVEFGATLKNGTT